MTRVGIVGGGITGLALLHHLADRDADAVLLEADDEPGGVVRSARVDGRLLEYGPQRIRLTDPVAALVDDLGLRGELLAADDSLPLYVYSDGALRLAPLSIGGFLRTDLLSWRGKLRVLAEPLTAAGSGDETAAELFSRKFGREAYERLIGPLYGGIYGSDPAEMPARHALENLLRLEERAGSLLWPALRRARDDDRAPPVSFADGLQTLPRALAERHADRVHLGTPVEDTRSDGDGFVLDAVGDHRVDHVVVTAPAGIAADLLDGVADGADALGRLTYNPLAMVHLRADADREGFGYQVRRGEGLHTLGVSWNASLFDRDDVYTCFLGGMYEPELPDRSDDELGRIAREEFADVMGTTADTLDVTRLEPGYPAWDRSWDALDELDLPEGVHLPTNYTGRLGVPSRIREARRLADEISD